MPTLRWLTRDDDVKAADAVPYRLLEEMPELSYGDSDTGNMLIQGDNLDALKALLPYYAGQVKCIYIDPPFNTGQAFEHYDDNVEHSVWLGLHWPRFELLRDLLAENGTLVVHGANLKVNEYGSPLFADFFFFITGFHGFHVFSGIVINIIIFFNVIIGTYEKRKNYEMVDKVGL